MSTASVSGSFLINCANCGTMVARDSVCPDCRHDHRSGEQHAKEVTDCKEEFARRLAIHSRNATKSMALRMTLGFLAAVTALLWVFVIFRGNILAFFGIGVLTVMSACLAFLVRVAEKRNPVDLYCPACETRLDELGIRYDSCPSCQADLA